MDPRKVLVPEVGLSIDVVRIATWLKRDGEVVKQDEALVEIETTKIDLVVESPDAGVLKILVTEGEDVQVGQAIATVMPQGKLRPARTKAAGLRSGSQVGLPSQPPAPPATPPVVQISRSEQTSLVFLCYRREDTQDLADRLHERLVSVYGRARVFMDVDSVPLGVNFLAHIENQMRQCAVMLVLIGRNWLRVTDEEGRPRLADDDDHVRLEIATALKKGIPVVPLLVQDAAMPRSKDLPEDIRPLGLRNGMTLPRAYWGQSVDRLMHALADLMK